jgi:hypothetical protein
MTTWKRTRYGITESRPFFSKIKKSLEIVAKNKLRFVILLLVYFATHTVGNAGILVFQWTIEKNFTTSKRMVIFQLTASMPVRLLRALLNYCVLRICINSIKRRGYKLEFFDLKDIIKSLQFSTFAKILFASEILSSPLCKAQALLPIDKPLANVYFIAGFFLNWLFSMVPILIIEDNNVPLISCFIWSAAMALNGQYNGSNFLCTLITFVLSPLIIGTPVLIMLQLLNFFEAFGYSSPSEVQLTTTE